jgi:hypothetical protein
MPMRLRQEIQEMLRTQLSATATLTGGLLSRRSERQNFPRAGAYALAHNDAIE